MDHKELTWQCGWGHCWSQELLNLRQQLGSPPFFCLFIILVLSVSVVFFRFVCLRPVSCVSNAADVSGLFVFVLCFVCPMLPMSLDCLSSSCVLCVQCCRCFWIVCLRLVSCVFNTADVSGLLVFVLCLVCPILSMSLYCLSSACFLCVQYCRFLWIVCLRPVSCVPNVLLVLVLCLVYLMFC